MNFEENCLVLRNRSLVEIYVAGILHVQFNRQKFIGFRSWSNMENKTYGIEFTFDGGTLIKCEYANPRIWSNILDQIGDIKKPNLGFRIWFMIYSKRWLAKYMPSYYKTDGFFCFRVLGYGLAINDTRKHPLLFSERNCGRGVTLGNYHLKTLKPLKP